MWTDLKALDAAGAIKSVPGYVAQAVHDRLDRQAWLARWRARVGDPDPQASAWADAMIDRHFGVRDRTANEHYLPPFRTSQLKLIILSDTDPPGVGAASACWLARTLLTATPYRWPALQRGGPTFRGVLGGIGHQPHRLTEADRIHGRHVGRAAGHLLGGPGGQRGGGKQPVGQSPSGGQQR
jgi:hypothetical protein